MRTLASLLLLVGLVPAIASSPASAAPAGPRDLFTPLPGFSLSQVDDARVEPSSYAAFDVDTATLDRRLDAAPQAGLRVRLPDPDGEMVAFDVAEDSIMEPGLAARHPELRTYAGRAVGDPTRTIRLDTTPLGLHASVRTLDGSRSWYVDPATTARGATEHLSYYRSALPEPPAFDESELLEEAHADAIAPRRAARVAAGAEVTLRTYRLAFATDPSYAAYVGGAANVLAEKVTLMNRVNQIYSDDLAVRMVLIDGTDRLDFDTAAEFTGADGPCGADPCYDPAAVAEGCSGGLLTSNEFALAQTVGADSFDIGHLGLGVDGGGIAGLGVVGESDKADGCTGLASPTGDFYAIDYVAHEMGHQFGGNHTFNGTQENCSLTNRNGSTSVEPGSGSSVMAYAGICGQDDLQPHSDPYFSQRTLDEVDAHVTAAPTSYAEEQTVALRRFDATDDTVTLRHEGREVTITHDGYPLQLATQVPVLMGEPATVGGYHDDPLPSEDGFTIALAGTDDVPRVEVVGTTGDVEVVIGVAVDGGDGTNQGVASATGNHAPSVVAPADKTVPLRTPFTLSGSGSDVDGDPLVYLWEQNDEGSALPTGGTALTSNAKTNGPLFRVFGTRADVSTAGSLTYGSPGENLADGSTTRTFPDLTQILAGTTNAATGTCPSAPTDPDAVVAPELVDCYSEFLPTAGYAGPMTFRLTARDLDPAGGGTQYDDTVLSVAGNAGPFLVTSRATAGTPAVAGGTETVTWDVNGTDATALAPQVRVLLSTDGGRTFPQVLVDRTPNDGSADVVWPRVSTTTARLKIEAVDNYFFDLSDADFAISDTAAPDTRVSGPATGSFVLDPTTSFALTSNEPVVSFDCTFDGRPLTCGTGSANVRLRPGQHTFTAAARDGAGNVDPTPVVRTFAAPIDDRSLRRATRGWKVVKQRSAYRGRLLQSTRPDQALILKVRGVRKLALVAPRGPRYGALRVYAGKRTIAFVDLSTRRDEATGVIPLRTFGKPFTGRVRIVTIGQRPVRVDGLGVYRG